MPTVPAMAGPPRMVPCCWNIVVGSSCGATASATVDPSAATVDTSAAFGVQSHWALTEATVCPQEALLSL